MLMLMLMLMFMFMCTKWYQTLDKSNDFCNEIVCYVLPLPSNLPPHLFDEFLLPLETHSNPLSFAR